MPLLQFIVILVCVGVILWAVNTYIPMPANYKKLLNIVAIICTVLWVLDLFGVFGPLSHIRVGR
jgi:Flp pilus assembly protein TadB